jgi:hypothetical protein
VIDLNTHTLPDLLAVGLTADEAEIVLRWRPQFMGRLAAGAADRCG